jgi:hypothetical protein
MYRGVKLTVSLMCYDYIFISTEIVVLKLIDRMQTFDAFAFFTQHLKLPLK